MKKLNVKNGDIYGKLKIIEEISAKERKRKERRFLCLCECGTKKEIDLNHLKFGKIVSCGCFRQENNKKNNFSHGLSNKRIYKIWQHIDQRCNNLKRKDYERYGGRGIKCEWKSFEEFYNDMKDGYKEGLTIERINNDGNYCKKNCRWATMKDQQRNKRNTIFLEINGQKKSLSEWCEIHKKNYHTIYAYYYKFCSLQNKEKLIKKILF